MRRLWRRSALCTLLLAPVLAVPVIGRSGAAAAAPVAEPVLSAAAVAAPAVGPVIHGITQVPTVGGPRLDGPGPIVDLPVGVPAPPPQTAVSWLLADVESGDVLAAQAAHLPLRPASTQKMLTSLVLLPRLDPATVYTAIPDDANAEGSKVGIVPGATYTVDELFRGLFLASGNDAAHALAEVGGGQEPTVAAMNALADTLQARDTTPANPSGLDADTQWSSAYDLALIARAGLEMESFRSYIATRRSQFPGAMPALPGEVRSSFEIANQNKLLVNYPGGIGVKTGYTSQARGTYVGAAARDGTTLVVTLMHTGPAAWRDGAALLDWGFAHRAAIRPVGQLVDPLPPASTTAGSGAEPSGLPRSGDGSVPAGRDGAGSDGAVAAGRDGTGSDGSVLAGRDGAGSDGAASAGNSSAAGDLVPGSVVDILVGALLLVVGGVAALRVRAVRRRRRRVARLRRPPRRPPPRDPLGAS